MNNFYLYYRKMERKEDNVQYCESIKSLYAQRHILSYSI